MGHMIEFVTKEAPATGYLALPDAAQGPAVLVLHAWWGLTEPFRQVCDQLAAAGFVAFAPDLYHGKTANTIEEAETLSGSLNGEAERVQHDLIGALQILRQNGATTPTDGHGTFGMIGFSLGGAYALNMSVEFADEVAAVVTFYTTYPGLDYSHAKAMYLCHFAENDPYEPTESVAAMEQELQKAGKTATFYTYPGTTHWFFEANCPDAYNAAAATLAWERTVAFLNVELHR